MFHRNSFKLHTLHYRTTIGSQTTFKLILISNFRKRSFASDPPFYAESTLGTCKNDWLDRPQLAGPSQTPEAPRGYFEEWPQLAGPSQTPEAPRGCTAMSGWVFDNVPQEFIQTSYTAL